MLNALKRSFTFKRGKSKKVVPAQAIGPPTTPQNIINGKTMSKEIWVEGQEAANIDLNAKEMQDLADQLSKRFKMECGFIVAHRCTYSGLDSHLVGVKKGRILIAVYEAFEPFQTIQGIMLKRVCDQPVRELMRLAKIPVEPLGDWPKKYEPVNACGGSRKLPSCASVKDLMDV